MENPEIDDDRRSRTAGGAEHPGRRRVLASLGIGASAVIAGCLGDSGDPSYEDGDVGDAEGDERSAEEMAAAEALAEQEADENVTSLESLALAEHEFVVEENYVGPTVQGVVENTGDERIKFVEVRVRVYDEGGNHLGRYLATTGDLDGGATWQFTAVVLESPADVADYDIAVLGLVT